MALWMHLFPMSKYPRLYRQGDIADFAIGAEGSDIEKGRVHARNVYSHVKTTTWVEKETTTKSCRHKQRKNDV
jgi:hypothetical protein